MSEIEPERKQPVGVPLRIDWHFPEGRRLVHPIVVKLEEDDGEFIVSEPTYHIHGTGTTRKDAIEAFKRIFSGYLDILSDEEENLSSYMYGQLEYLRSVIRTEQ
jgi:hypothetical protein